MVLLPFVNRDIAVSGETLTLRRLDASSAGDLHAIELRSFPRPWSRQMVEEEFDKDVACIVGLMHGESLLGYYIVEIVADEMHLLTIAVHPAARGHGYGKVLMQCALDYASQSNLGLVLLEVRTGNTVARNLYEQLGFQLAYTRRGYYTDTGEDALVMQRALSRSNCTDLPVI